MPQFEAVWPDLVSHAREAEFVRPFGRGDRKEPQYVAERDAILFENGRTDLVHRKNWNRAWSELQRNGELSVAKFSGAAGTHRAATALPFLADALGLPADRSERRIWLSAAYDE
jgi:hypothetical protein